LKRAVPQDANEVPLSLTLEDVEEPSRQSLPEANRRVYTSAAMLGLAISVGAYGLLAPRQGDAAMATEPVSSDSAKADGTSGLTLPSVAVSTESSVAVASASSQSPTIKHAVQEGQTLSKVAELYRTSVEQIASLNRIKPDTTLYVGQVLTIPVGPMSIAGPIATSARQLPALKPIPVVTRPVAVDPVQSAQTVQASLNVQPKPALQSLQQKRDQLKQSLAELKSEEPSKSQTVAMMPQAESQQLTAYRVNPGETLSSIAQALGISTQELAALNRLSNPNLVQANQFIQVPQKSAQSPVAQALPEQQPAQSPVAVGNVQVPTVPSLASTQSPSAPLAIGGDAHQFAFRPSRNRAPEVQQVDVRRSDDQYVNTLMGEINRLRERYQSSRSANREAPKPEAAPVSSRRNPQFNSSRAVSSLRTESRSANGQTRLERMLSDAPKQRQVVATAPARSESYAPILRSPIGKTVSPNLPPLGRSDAYMPGDRMKGYIWPAKGMLSSPYGWRWGRMHKGIDIAAPVGTPIMAAAPGKVVTAGWNDGGYGNLVEVEHADGSVTLYAHNNRILVRVGQQVRQGQQIAEMGSTGFSTGPHSHFEVHLPGRGAVNPIALLPQSRS
jgi:murein DD-endopeptidase MepM/ murein hydrolase activator NlpD